ncbi:MAG: DUF4143 domain-containing protein [Chitinispirillaceae bacterium]|nr:DUF4143 domain-containing protein [Chitinispirillaceae bacterium]
MARGADTRNSQFLLLGSASRDLIRQSSETLAGRISYLELTPFLLSECPPIPGISLFDYWLRGDYPRTLLSSDIQTSFIWMNDFLKLFIERDVLQIKPGISSQSVSRLLQMIAHVHGQTINYSRLGSSLNLSDNTVRHYLDLLAGTFIIRILQPFHDNLKKRLIKSPKVYIRDTGLLHALLSIESVDSLFGHPVFGSSWESVVIENILAHLKPSVVPSFYRTAKGEEMDLVLKFGQKKLAIECKATVSPEVTRSIIISINDLRPDHVFIVAPVNETYPLSPMVTVPNQVLIWCGSKIEVCLASGRPLVWLSPPITQPQAVPAHQQHPC